MKKKAKNERGTIMSFFNNKKSEEIRRPSRRNKKESQPISSDIHFGSSVQVEKTSLILFDEVRHRNKLKSLIFSSFNRLKH